MYKFLNFSTILFSYILITLLVISCGDSSGVIDGSSVDDATGGNDGSSVGDATGGNGGSSVDDATGGNDGSSVGDATGGNDGSSVGDATGGNGGNVPPVEISEKCFLENRQDADSWLAVLCYEGEVMAEIAKTAGTEAIDFLIPSTERTEGNTSRTWDISTARQIQISYAKDYTLALDNTADGFIEMIADATDSVATESDATESDATDATTDPVDAAYLLQRLTINSNSFIDTADQLRSIGITFSPVSGSPINVAIAPKLAVKSQDDFISMGRFTAPPLGELNHPLSYVLANDLDLVAPGEEGAKFDDSIIAVADASFDFDGGGHTISLNSEIDAVANDKPAAIIGELKQGNEFKNFTLDINKTISGSNYVGSLLGYSADTFLNIFHDIKININSNITDFGGAPGYVYAGGVVGQSCADINNVVVKTGAGAAIQAGITFSEAGGSGFYLGGLAGMISCTTIKSSINSNVVDVKIGVGSDDLVVDSEINDVHIGGLAGAIIRSPMINNLVKLAIYRDENLPTGVTFFQAAGFVGYSSETSEVTNNLIYTDFSNLGSADYVAGVLAYMANTPLNNNIANNMLFIADGFTGSDVQQNFGVTCNTTLNGELINITNNFFSTPVTDYGTNEKLASFVYLVRNNINFKNLILDNKTDTGMFKTGSFLNTVKAKVATAILSTFAEGTDSTVAAVLKASDSWEEGSQGYPQLKVPTDFVGSLTKSEIETYWAATNDLIQAGLADRAARAASQQ